MCTCVQVCTCAGKFINKICLSCGSGGWEAQAHGPDMFSVPEAKSIPLATPSRQEQVMFMCRGRNGSHVKKPDSSCRGPKLYSICDNRVLMTPPPFKKRFHLPTLLNWGYIFGIVTPQRSDCSLFSPLNATPSHGVQCPLPWWCEHTCLITCS